MRARPLSIATVYRRHKFRDYIADDMSLVRWLKISEAFARAGYEVDMVVDIDDADAKPPPGVRFVPFGGIDWDRYDVVKTLFHLGFESLAASGGRHHPFIISKLGSVVGADDGEPGVFFHGEERGTLFHIQQDIARHSRFVSILTDPSIHLWRRQHGDATRIVKAPTGVDQVLPRVRRNPYRDFDERIALYLGTVYSTTQDDINRLWQYRLNALGAALRRRGIRLCLVGPGRTNLLDPDAVTWLGAVDHDDTWDFLYFADAGIVLAQGPGQHNESSKLYQYLRTGLPVVSETHVPNNSLIEETVLGHIAPYDQPEAMAALVSDAIDRRWDNERAISYMAAHHTWDRRVARYDRLIRAALDAGA